MEPLEERWGFLSPWTDVLRGRLSYEWPVPEDEGEVWSMPQRDLQVFPPARFEDANVEKKLSKKKEKEFLAELQDFREALALVAAVGHVDKVAWRYLLEHQCDVDFGVEGEEEFEEEIPVRFQLCLLRGRTRFSYSVKLKDDLVRWFGPSQRADPTEDFLETLQQIAVLAGNLTKDKPGVDLVIPVAVDFSSFKAGGDLKPLEDMWIAGMVVQKKWEAFNDVDVQPGSLRCTYRLDPMLLDIGDTLCSCERVNMLKILVRDNVRFSYLSISASLVTELRDDAFTARLKLGDVMRSIFDSEWRPRRLAHTTSHSDAASDEASSQIRSTDLDCEFHDSNNELAAMCSAIVTNQTTQKLLMHMRLQEADSDGINGVHTWKWLAYAFFSKRARESSALKSLALISINCMSVANMEALVSIVASDHPEEDLCGCPRGQVPERDAILKGRSPIYWRLTSRGQPDEAFDPLVLKASTRSVRTFSDDGESELVNAMVPGFGRCLVKRTDLVVPEARASSTRDQGGISSLFLELSNREPFGSDGLLLLLGSVGMSLKELTLDGPGLEMDTNMVLRCCPNLEELAICRYRVEIRFSFASYQSSREPLPALDCDWDDPIELMRRLSDDSSPLAQCTRRLRLHLEKAVPFFWFAESVDAGQVADMLAVNRDLEYLDVIVRARFREYFDKLRKFHRAPVARALKLSAASKAAFLSVFPGYVLILTSKRGRSDAAACRLDEDVLSNIFAFAASPVLRQVFVRRPKENDGDNWYTEVPI